MPILKSLWNAPAKDDHRNPQVWWSLPYSSHPKTSPRTPVFLTSARRCHVRWRPQCLCRRQLSLARILAEGGIMTPFWCLLRVQTSEARTGPEHLTPCMFTVFIQRNCSQTAAQTVSQYWMPLVLGQQGTHFRTGHPSFSRFLSLSLFRSRPCFHWNPVQPFPPCEFHQKTIILVNVEHLQQCIILPRNKLV